MTNSGGGLYQDLHRLRRRRRDPGGRGALLRRISDGNVKIKAAGGIANLQDAEDFLKLGADRLGTSRIVKAVKAMEKGE